MLLSLDISACNFNQLQLKQCFTAPEICFSDSAADQQIKAMFYFPWLNFSEIAFFWLSLFSRAVFAHFP